jgi:hypothetical protein
MKRMMAREQESSLVLTKVQYTQKQNKNRPGVLHYGMKYRASWLSLTFHGLPNNQSEGEPPEAISC